MCWSWFVSLSLHVVDVSFVSDYVTNLSYPTPCTGLFMGKAKKIAIAKSGVKLVDGMRLWVDTRTLKMLTVKGDNCEWDL